MKLFKIKMLVILLTSIAFHSHAQKSETKQPIFSAYPNSITVDNLALANSVTNAKGADVILNLAEGFKFKGSVISNIQNQANLQIITMRSSENPKTLLEISKITNEDNSILYKGRILNSDAADGYELKNIDGTYSLEKFELAKILQQCKQ